MNQRGIVALGIASLAFAISLAALLRTAGQRIEVGTLAAWASAIGSVAAVSVALWKSGDEERRRVRHEKRKQAEDVSAWISDSRSAGVIVDAADQQSPQDRIAPLITISNPSKTPIYKVTATIDYGPNSEGKGTTETHRTFLRSVPPGTYTFAMSKPKPIYSRTSDGVAISFTDSSGNHWRRSTNGYLDELEASELDECKTEGADYEVLDGLPG